MISHEFLADKTLLVVRPEGRLTKEDFEALAAAVDPVIEERGELRGLLIDAPKFPGWAGFGDFVAHMKFVRNHHTNIEKVAFVSDSNIASILPPLAKHFVAAEIRHFAAGKREDALTWLAG